MCSIKKWKILTAFISLEIVFIDVCDFGEYAENQEMELAFIYFFLPLYMYETEMWTISLLC